MRVAVAGGTGTVGRPVVEALTAAGHEPVVLAPSRGVDLVTGDGLAEAMAGVEAVIDLANKVTMKAAEARAFFEAGTRNLLAAGERAGVRHHLLLSIVGCDRVETGYYAGKLRQEELVRTGSVPWTIQRCTQFHDFAGQFMASMPGPVAAVPRVPNQPIDTRDVADVLVGLVAGEPSGTVPDLAGPRREILLDQARRLVRVRGGKRLVLRLPLAALGRAGRQMAEGGLLPTEPGPRGTRTFDEWLAGRAGAARR
ncbi:NAD(P)H-binding protein [Streptomyces calidiresistens]|uniref:NAD(P)H-binding protein n=1 Tax=Streptomyces calidiresistens TaxID=1485586 RepID=A0A7W3T1R3_9ACTN|nr:NAD(P)H-binding protein [Streptomyces calidiresistens]MBB0229315.1 NAD(P)H-binding protein [Streptomyces calidiresistens]